jgi:anti-anti-sigma factor
VLDLGERRTLPGDAVEEVVLTHRTLQDAGGRCAVVVGPALAAQLSIAYPEGLLWAAARPAAIAALHGARTSVRARLRRRGRTVHVALAGELDLAALPAIEEPLARVVTLAQQREPIVFDVAGVTFVDLSGLRAITTAAVRCQLAGAPTRVVGARAQFRDLVEHLGWQVQLPGVVLADDDADRLGRERDAILAELDDQFDTGRRAVIATDLRGRVTHWNRAAQRLYGWTRAEVLGRPITEFMVGPEDRQLAERIMLAVQEHGVWEGGFEVRRKDGRTFTAHVRDTIIEDQEGRPLGLLGTSVDASDDPRDDPR